MIDVLKKSKWYSYLHLYLKLGTSYHYHSLIMVCTTGYTRKRAPCTCLRTCVCGKRHDLIIPFQHGNDAPTLTILNTFTFPLRKPLPSNLPAVLIPRNNIPLEDPLDLESVLESSLEEGRDDGSASMEMRDYPHLAARCEEPLHCTDEILMLSSHPVAVCGDDAGEGSFTPQGKGIIQDAPFMWMNGNTGWGDWGAIG